MTVLNPDTKVLIIGSGVAGVALAQILRKANIPFDVFERAGESRQQGWTFGLDECLPELEPLLPDDIDRLDTASANYRVGKTDSICFWDTKTNKSLGVTGNNSAGGPKRTIFANRNQFREILAKNTNVQYNKRFSHYEEDKSGITAYFTDGTSARGHVLIGADGSKSEVRSQLLKGFSAVPSNYVLNHGRLRLTKEQWEPLVAKGNTGMILAEGGLKTVMMVAEWLEDGDAIFDWNSAYKVETAGDEHAWSQAASKEQLLQKTLGHLAHYPKYVYDAIKSGGVDNVTQPPLILRETVLPEYGLPRGRVTIIGDAAHSMVPFMGMGANTAVLDACFIGKGLRDGIANGDDLEWVLKNYEDTMIPYGRDLVLKSRAVGNADDTGDISGSRLSKAQ